MKNHCQTFFADLGATLQESKDSLRGTFARTAESVKADRSPANVVRQAADAGLELAVHTMLVVPGQAAHHLIARVEEASESFPLLNKAADTLGVFNFRATATLLQNYGRLRLAAGLDAPVPAEEEIPPTLKTPVFGAVT